MANNGKRRKVLCTKTFSPCSYMTYTQGTKYNCNELDNWFKIYGGEFDLSCGKEVFDKYFKILYNQKLKIYAHKGN